MPEPWVEVLEYACDWASGTNSEDDVVADITEGAYSDFGRKYDGENDHTDMDNKTFELSDFLADVMHYADCSDMAATVNVFTRAIGVSSSLVKKIEGTFVYKRIKPVGEINWRLLGSGSFDYHWVAWYDILIDDACLKLCDNQDPPGNERIPIGEILDDPINEDYKEDLYYSGDWDHDYMPFNITTIE